MWVTAPSTPTRVMPRRKLHPELGGRREARTIRSVAGGRSDRTGGAPRELGLSGLVFPLPLLTKGHCWSVVIEVRPGRRADAAAAVC